MKQTLVLTAVVVALLVSPTLNAQSKKAAEKTEPAKSTLALEGYCPVAYGAMQKAVKGDPKVTATYKSQTYAFLSNDAKNMFLKDPAKFLPKYDGYCATAVTMGQKMKSDPTLFAIHEGSLYLFSNKMAKESFEKDPAATITMADKQWAELSK